MKKLFILIFIALLAWSGCKNKENLTDKNNSVPNNDGTNNTEQQLSTLDSLKTPIEKVKHYYKPNYTLLQGKLTKELYYGPPGYGQTPDKDKKDSIYFLNLDRPFDISTHPRSGKPDYEDINNIKKLQLISLNDFNEKILERSVNLDVVVKGMLIRNKGEHNPSEITMELIGIH